MMEKRQGNQPIQQFQVVNTGGENRLESGRLRGKVPLEYEYLRKARQAIEQMENGIDLEEDLEQDPAPYI